MSTSTFPTLRMPTKTEIATTRWGCCCTNRTTAFVLICFILLGDITVGIESWLVTLGIMAPAVKSIVVTSPSSIMRNSTSFTVGNSTGSLWLSPQIVSSPATAAAALNSTSTMLVIRSLRSWYALDAIYCTFDISIALIAFYGLLQYRPKWLKPLRILEFVWLIVMCMLLVVGLLAFITSSVVLSKLFINIVAWMFSANAEPMFEVEEEKHGQGFSLPIGSVVISIVIQAWILAILAGAAHELRLTNEQRRAVAGEEASGVEYNRMTDFVASPRNAGGAPPPYSSSDDVPLPTIRQHGAANDSSNRQNTTNTTATGVAVNGFHNNLNGKMAGNYWDVEASNNPHHSNNDDFEVIGGATNVGGVRSASSVVVEFDEPFEPHTGSGGARGPQSKL